LSRPATFSDGLKRFVVRVGILCAIHVLPTLAAFVGIPLSDGNAAAVREVAAVGIVWATAAWASTQGRRRPEGEG
jgi:hypothetical protein